MTDRYTNSGASGADDGTSKPDAFETLTAAFTGSSAGDREFLAHTHDESTAASITLTSPGTIDNYVQLFSVDYAGSSPPVNADIAAGAEVKTGAGAYNITFAGFAISKGINYRAGVGGSSTVNIGNSTAAFDWLFEDCELELASTGGGPTFAFGGSIVTAQKLRLKNSNLKFGHVNQSITLTTVDFSWIGGAVSASGAAPTTLFSGLARLSNVYMEGVDLSHLGSGKTIFPAAGVGKGVLINCKLNAAVTIAARPTNHLARYEVLNCNSGDVNYDNRIIDYYGDMTTETTIVRTGGASDGTTPISHKIVTTANAAPETPFRSAPMEVWVETVGSPITITVEGIWGGGAVPDDDEIWLEADYLGTSGFPISSRISDRMASLLSTPAGQAAGSGTWGGSTTKFALSVTLTPAEKGLITLNVMAGAASSTFYIDPKPVIT